MEFIWQTKYSRIFQRNGKKIQPISIIYNQFMKEILITHNAPLTA